LHIDAQIPGPDFFTDIAQGADAVQERIPLMCYASDFVFLIIRCSLTPSFSAFLFLLQVKHHITVTAEYPELFPNSFTKLILDYK